MAQKEKHVVNEKHVVKLLLSSIVFFCFSIVQLGGTEGEICSQGKTCSQGETCSQAFAIFKSFLFVLK